MAFVGTAAMVGGGSALLGGALIGAGVGGLYSAITGDGNILNSMLTGGLIGGADGGIGAAMAPNAAVASASPFYTAAPSATAVKTVLPATQAATAGGSMGGISAGGAFTPTAGSAAKFTLPSVSQGVSGAKMLGYGLAGTTAMQLLDGTKGGIPVGGTAYPGDIRPFEYSARPVSETGQSPFPTTQYDMAGNPMLDSRERTYFDQGFQPLQAYKAGTANPNPTMAAQGGIMSAYPMEKYGNTIPNTEVYGLGMAKGGIADLGSYSDGGRMLKGPGDGMSDNIPGIIAGKQPARLADGEFVVPADVVSHLGNGSTDAGAKRLYAMMDTVRKARTGNKKQGKQIKAEKYLPA
jgi:hypothetical protein